jgi:hypothetical protein
MKGAIMATPPTRTRRRRGAKPAQEAEPQEPEDEGEDEEDEAEAKAKAEAEKKAKREKRVNQEQEQTATLLQRTGEHPRVPGRDVGDDEPIADVARDLNITAGKAAFLLMIDAVAKGKVPALEGDDDDDLVQAIIEARAAADEYSSWGWLAARSSRPESWIKAELAEVDAYTPKAENISSVRAKAKAAAQPKEDEESEDGEDEPKPATRRRRRARGNAS